MQPWTGRRGCLKHGRRRSASPALRQGHAGGHGEAPHAVECVVPHPDHAARRAASCAAASRRASRTVNRSGIREWSLAAESSARAAARIVGQGGQLVRQVVQYHNGGYCYSLSEPLLLTGSTTPVQYNNGVHALFGSLGAHYLLRPSFQGRNQHALGYLLLTSILVLRYKAQQCNLVLIQS